MMKYKLLDPLRGLAALWVFLFHFPFTEAFQHTFPFAHRLFKMGDLGVPMFFVISGFCMMVAGRKAIANNESAGTFLYRRTLRIYPPFWCSIVVVALLPFAMEWISSLKSGRYISPSPDHLNYRFIGFELSEWCRVATLTQVFCPDMEAINLQQKFTTINGVYWTLAIEVQFYVVVVAFAVKLHRWFFRVLILVTLISVPFLFFPSTFVTGHFLPYWPMFALGCLLFWAFERGFTPEILPSPWPKVVSITGTCVVLGALVWCAAMGLSPGHLGFATFFAMVLWAARGSGLPLNRLPPAAARVVFRVLELMTLFGAMSYSLYLLHGRLALLVHQVTRQVLPPDGMACDAAVILGTAALCYPFYRYCEAPFMRGRGRTAGSSRPDFRTKQPTFAGSSN